MAISSDGVGECIVKNACNGCIRKLPHSILAGILLCLEVL